jgi:hypothetical protein
VDFYHGYYEENREQVRNIFRKPDLFRSAGEASAKLKKIAGNFISGSGLTVRPAL